MNIKGYMGINMNKSSTLLVLRRNYWLLIRRTNKSLHGSSSSGGVTEPSSMLLFLRSTRSPPPRHTAASSLSVKSGRTPPQQTHAHSQTYGLTSTYRTGTLQHFNLQIHSRGINDKERETKTEREKFCSQ